MSYYRPRYHLAPAVGRLNDPNGVYFENDVLHVYYQHDPQWPFGTKRTGWGHATITRTDRHWTHLPGALAPLTDYDKDGCYSGSAVVVDGELELFYTGNAKTDGIRRATQNLVHVSGRCRPDGGTHTRSELNPLIDGPAVGFTAHYRDPHLSYRDGRWVMILGAQSNEEQGCVVMYTSQDRRAWDFAGQITFDVSDAVKGSAPDLIPGGYMWECPNLVTLEDSSTGKSYDVLIFLPQGMHEPYQSEDTCGYVVGHLNGTTFHVERGFSILDWGHEFYAPQIAHNSESTLLVGWMGKPAQDDQPTKAEAWVHTTTLVRELELIDGHVWQRPWASISPAEADADFGPVVVFSGELERGDVVLLKDSTGSDIAKFECGNELTLARNGQPYGKPDDVRSAPNTAESIEITAVCDASCLEIYAGAQVFSSRVFPDHPIVGFTKEKSTKSQN